MANFALRLPNSIYDDLKQIAASEGVSMNQFIMSAVSERVALAKVTYRLNKNTTRLSTADFINFLEKNVKNNPPLDQDKL
ncbi:toxin-antitoxin system HicB family antitoxin [Caedibacter taeniospiralis]|uniref:toxin-antitoxin system HicB family antitoxin n=1 Tax=Caedibacter taeniospiralis TaxID=28907 RepID=UPI000C280416|nr:toxin-antitoxin system HicB family antitoxin [Caedibacter taeniospiralis]